MKFKKYIANLLPDSVYLQIIYKRRFGVKLDLKNPQTYTEKLQWLKLHDRKLLYTTMVDKYAVREYVKEKIGGEYLIPLVGGPWTNADDINFDSLPDQFVLKCTHDSGSVMICSDKKTFDIQVAKEKLNMALKHNFYYWAREWPYKNVKPQIIAEQYMGEMIDYKFMCFNGNPMIVTVHKDRFTNHTQNIYDINWNPIDTTKGKIEKYKGTIHKPATFDLMLQYSTVLSQNTYFLRVDWYEAGGKLYFGELTFFDGAGYSEFNKPGYNEYVGGLIKLP